MNRRKSKRLFLIVLIVFGIITIYYFNDDETYNESNSKVPVVLWWTPFGSKKEYKKCGQTVCYFTHNRSYERDERLKTILFYGSDIRVTDLPNRRSGNANWGLVHEESPRNNPILVNEDLLSLFNFSSTFSRYSDVPLTLLDLPARNELTDLRYYVTTFEKNRLAATESLAPILYIQSDCDTASDRDSYVKTLMKYIKIDSYGRCLNNKQLPNNLDKNHLDKLKDDEFYKFVGKYKFTLAMENAICNDYITEKLWRPLLVGSVPIYYGSPSFKDWLPNDNSAISVLDFHTPKLLSEHLIALQNNDREYEFYLNHKLKQQVTNSKLTIANKEFVDYMEEFECFVCSTSKVQTLSEKHYDCPLPKNSWWFDQWKIERCGAKLVKRYLSNNETIEDLDKFNLMKYQMYTGKECR